jgi:hypothetical protein
MAVSVCPADEVQASADQVWSLLRDPARLDLWWDARVLRSTPPGPLAPGQHIEARAKGLLPARIWFDVTAIDDALHRLQMTAHLPLGIVDHVTLTIAPLGPERCLLRFG